MAAHKKGQEATGAYTHAKTVCTPSDMYDSEGYPVGGSKSAMADVSEASGPDTQPRSGYAPGGLSRVLPKR